MNNLKFLLKKISLVSIGFLLIFIVGCSNYEGTMNNYAPGNYNFDELNSYGDWINIEPYGEVWQPYVVNGWMPFDNGHWTYADANWTWVSYEPFGWIVYHYGYWYDDPFYGWVWIPSDNSWSPARVMWIDYDDYVGWAPLPPPGIIYGNPWEPNEHRYWHVVRHKDFTEDNIRNYRINDPIRNENNGRGIVNRPPDRQLVEKSMGRQVPEVKMQHETVKLPPRQVQKMNLPPQEHKRVEQYTPRVKREVLVPKAEYHKQHSEKSKSNK